MRSSIDKRTRSVRKMTGTSFNAKGQGGSAVGYSGSGSGGGGSNSNIRHIASGQILLADDGHGGGRMSITRRYGEPQQSGEDVDDFEDDGDDGDNHHRSLNSIEESHQQLSSRNVVNRMRSNDNDRNSYNDDVQVDYGGIEEEAIMFPQSTHSWLFTQEMTSLPFWFAVAIAVLSYVCLSLALINIFEDYESDNPFSVPFNVLPSVRIAQYLAMVIALLMEEEIPTGLYLLRTISRESLHKKFPKMKFWRFVVSALVRLGMGYLFLFNTFVVVAQAEAVLDIFYDVLALQFLQQLDDIAFNLSKIDVFGKSLKHAALSKCFRAEFEKKKFGLRKSMNKYLKGIYFVNLLLLFSGMAWITQIQENGGFHAESITVTFGDQVWNDAIVKTASGELETRVLLFSYFNGVYQKSDYVHDGRPVYTEQNKFDGGPFVHTVPAEIIYCNSEDAWVFAHRDIRKSKDSDESDCSWLLRSPKTSDYNILEVTGDWSIWTGSLEQNGHFSAIDNKCQSEVDCNYHGQCNEDGTCQCSPDLGFYGMHCEHKKTCSLIRGGEGGSWSQANYPSHEAVVYQRPLYIYEEGLPDATLVRENVDKDEDLVYLLYSGSRWLGTVYPDTKRVRASRQDWMIYMSDFHAFWENTFNTRTKFASDPTTQSSIIGIDFYNVGKQGEEFGPFGELFPLSNPKGSGFMRCIEGEFVAYRWDIIYLNHNLDFSDDSVGTIVVNYDLRKGREYESNLLDKECNNPITDIDFDVKSEKLPAYETHDILEMKYSLDKSQLRGSNIWNSTSGMIEFCHVVRLVDPPVGPNPQEVIFDYSNQTVVLWEEFQKVSQTVKV